MLFARLKHAKETIKKKQAELKKTEQGYQKEQATHESLKKNIAKLEVKMYQYCLHGAILYDF